MRGLIVGSVIYKINYLITTWVSGLPEENNRYEEFMMKNPIVPILYAPISEELVFRGGLFNCFHYLQQKAMKSTTPIQQRTSIHNFLSSPGFPHLFSALLFGQLHLIGNKKLLPSFALNSQYLLHYFFTSAEFSILYASTGTIFAPITAHIINNALCLLVQKTFSR